MDLQTKANKKKWFPANHVLRPDMILKTMHLEVGPCLFQHEEGK